MNNRLMVSTEFTPVDPAFVKVTFVRHIIIWLLIAVSVVSTYFTLLPDVEGWWAIALWTICGLLVIVAVWDVWLALRRAKALGYVELEDELLIRKGIMFQEVTMVPYGRMQQVNLGTGPLLTKFGLASVQLVTASASSNASIPGLPLAEAERLREKLTRLGQTKLEGL
ncbi:PH domain-containing protein [Arcanobacterium haemolyticum]|uniref:PH domain-containing protein n=1 Tax=Arcanobacterium haemolyticum TaxID=28264 RepID=UPI0015EC1448|nr:PH domain-containing protein [Arcanobacterium haemolyticum]